MDKKLVIAELSYIFNLIKSGYDDASFGRYLIASGKIDQAIKEHCRSYGLVIKKGLNFDKLIDSKVSSFFHGELDENDPKFKGVSSWLKLKIFFPKTVSDNVEYGEGIQLDNTYEAKSVFELLERNKEPGAKDLEGLEGRMVTLVGSMAEKLLLNYKKKQKEKGDRFVIIKNVDEDGAVNDLDTVSSDRDEQEEMDYKELESIVTKYVEKHGSDLEKKVYKLSLDGYERKEIFEKLKISESRLFGVLKEIRKLIHSCSVKYKLESLKSHLEKLNDKFKDKSVWTTKEIVEGALSYIKKNGNEVDMNVFEARVVDKYKPEYISVNLKLDKDEINKSFVNIQAMLTKFFEKEKEIDSAFKDDLFKRFEKFEKLKPELIKEYQETYDKKNKTEGVTLADKAMAYLKSKGTKENQEIFKLRIVDQGTAENVAEKLKINLEELNKRLESASTLVKKFVKEENLKGTHVDKVLDKLNKVQNLKEKRELKTPNEKIITEIPSLKVQIRKYLKKHDDELSIFELNFPYKKVPEYMAKFLKVDLKELNRRLESTKKLLTEFIDENYSEKKDTTEVKEFLAMFNKVDKLDEEKMKTIEIKEYPQKKDQDKKESSFKELESIVANLEKLFSVKKKELNPKIARITEYLDELSFRIQTKL